MLDEKKFYKNLADLIKKRRKDLGLTNESLAFDSKIDISKISLLQNDKAGCNGYTLYKILFGLGFDIFDIKAQKLGHINSAIKDCDKKQLDMILRMIDAIKKEY
jgi:hypothetical protein